MPDKQELSEFEIARQRLCMDLGGYEKLSVMELSLIERAVYLEQKIHEIEAATTGEQIDSGEYTKLVNTLIRLYCQLGVKRREGTIFGALCRDVNRPHTSAKPLARN